MSAINEMNVDTSLLCRGCLVESGEMKNMIDYGLLDDFYKFSDVKINGPESQSHWSDLLCLSCETTLLECRRFRALCQRSDSILRNSIKSKLLSMAVNEEVIEQSLEKSQNNSILCDLYEKKLTIMITAPNTNSKIILSCPYNCSETFLKRSELLNHLLKKHKVESDFHIELQYYCSIEKCSYHLDAGKSKHFTGRKFLNQHYNKVHRDKAFNCDVCKLSFTTSTAYNRHLATCNFTYECRNCDRVYKTNEKLLVHLMRNHPTLHQQYKDERKAEKRKLKINLDSKKSKVDTDTYSCDSPKRSSATQTIKPDENIRNDITLPLWPEKNDAFETKTDEISTQTVFEDLLSLKSQASEDSIYFSETVSLSDIQTQTFPIEFGLSRSNKETLTSETQSPDLSIKETQTCLCLYDSPKFNCVYDSVSPSPVMSLTSTETQTAGLGSIDAFLGFNTAETQTSFEENLDKDDL